MEPGGHGHDWSAFGYPQFEIAAHLASVFMHFHKYVDQPKMMRQKGLPGSSMTQ